VPLRSTSNELSLGSLLGGRYRILSKLGRGGMGAVYKAQDLKLDRLVAMKVIRGEMAADHSMMQRFKQELILARDVTHHNVIRLYDIGEAEGVDFITMEFVEGQDLSGLLKLRGKLPAAEAADIVKQICAGLEVAHARGIVHRDLKPGNIMLDAAGRIVVMDFGLARGLESGGMTHAGALVGTFEYMSPEQANGAQVDARSDLYTVGLILYELLTGVQPFHSESVITSLMLRTRERAQPPTVHEASIPKSISRICSKCLEIASADRYQSAAELISDLENWRTPSVRKRPASWKWITVGAASVTVLAIAAAVYLLRPKSTATEAHQPITVLVADFTNHTGDSVFDGTLEPMFNVALEGASFVNAFDRTRAHKLAAKLPKPSETRMKILRA
jgi:eukaryotic-like serine/threonine-protein kinase